MSMFCPQCGSSKDVDARFCSSCGTPLKPDAAARPQTQGAEWEFTSEPEAAAGAPTQPSFATQSEARPKPRGKPRLTLVIGLGATAVIGLLIMIIMIAVTYESTFQNNNSSSNTLSNNSPNSVSDAVTAPTPTEVPTPAQPAAELAFFAAKDAVQSQFISAQNDMVKHQIAGAWKDHGPCSALKTPKFTNWLGTISKIKYDGDVNFDIGDDIKLETSVDSSSRLFKDEIAHLKQGDAVKISGTFDSSAPCWADPLTDELANGDEGSVERPKFHVRLLRVVHDT
jgi:hypothetical protein